MQRIIKDADAALEKLKRENPDEYIRVIETLRDSIAEFNNIFHSARLA